jgi:hypothetical protein
MPSRPPEHYAEAERLIAATPETPESGRSRCACTARPGRLKRNAQDCACHAHAGGPDSPRIRGSRTALSASGLIMSSPGLMYAVSTCPRRQAARPFVVVRARTPRAGLRAGRVLAS